MRRWWKRRNLLAFRSMRGLWTSPPIGSQKNSVRDTQAQYRRALLRKDRLHRRFSAVGVWSPL